MGAATEAELEDRKLRVEDAKNATFAAVEVSRAAAALCFEAVKCCPIMPKGVADFSQHSSAMSIDQKGSLLRQHPANRAVISTA